MKRGRKALTIPSIDWKCYIPINIATKVDLILLDPVKGKPIHGARSALVTQLLRDWLIRQGHSPAADTQNGKDIEGIDTLAAPCHD